jgi:hypothetical protein
MHCGTTLRFEQPAALTTDLLRPAFVFLCLRSALSRHETSASDSGPRIGLLLPVARLIGEHFSQLERRDLKKFASLRCRVESELHLIDAVQGAL